MSALTEAPADLNPAADEKIILFTATTQEEKRRKHHGSRADLVLVTLEPAKYGGVTERCVLDCESRTIKSRAEFEKGASKREYTPLATLPDTIIAEIVAAVRESRTLSPAEKRLILGEPERLPELSSDSAGDEPSKSER